MDDHILMCVLKCTAHPAKQSDTFSYRQLSNVRILPDGLAFDVLHDEVRQPIFGGSAVQEPGNIGMIKVSENLALVPEPPNYEIIVHPATNKLDRHPFLELIVG